MRIRLTVDVPVESIHGMTKGRVLDVLENEDGKPRYQSFKFGGAWVLTDQGAKLKLWPHEFEVVESDVVDDN